jgi:signal transduction histidine kinase
MSRPRTHAEQLERLSAEVAALRAQLRQAQRLAAVGTMTAMVAHEFNNILTPIISYAQLAKRNPALQAKAIDRAADGGQRATEICRAILGMARPTDTPRRVTLLQLVQDTLAAMAREPQKDGIELVLDVPQDIAVAARTTELQQVLLNLIINARWAVLAKPQPRRIGISARRDKRCVTIEVADTGVGINPADVQRIFEPFYTTKGAEGSGLGLALCREIVTSMRGQIDVRSQPGQGATFTIRLPAACAAA